MKQIFLRQIFNYPKYPFLSDCISKNLYPYVQVKKGHIGCVNSLDISHDLGRYLLSGGDDTKIFLWDLYAPFDYPPKRIFIGHESNIFCNIFNHSDTHFISTGADGQILYFDIERSPDPLSTFLDVILGHFSVIYRLSYTKSNENIFLSAGDDHCCIMWDIRMQKVAGISFYDFSLSSVNCSPYLSTPYNYLVGGKSLYLRDLRKTEFNQYRLEDNHNNNPNVLTQFNIDGFDISNINYNPSYPSFVATVNGSFPRVYSLLHNPKDPSLFVNPSFILTSNEYFNTTTMKGCGFGGFNNEYIFAGSDNHHILVWNLNDTSHYYLRSNKKRPAPLSSTYFVDDQPIKTIYLPHKQNLPPARSIINSLIYHPYLHQVYGCGVEKVIRIWSSYPFDDTLISHPEIQAREVLSLEECLESMHNQQTDYTVNECKRTISQFDYLTSLNQRSSRHRIANPIMPSEDISNWEFSSSSSDESDSSDDNLSSNTLINQLESSGNLPEILFKMMHDTIHLDTHNDLSIFDDNKLNDSETQTSLDPKNQQDPSPSDQD